MGKLISSKMDFLLLFIMFVMIGQTILYLEALPLLNIAFFGLRVCCFITIVVLLYLTENRLTWFDVAFGLYALVFLIAVLMNNASLLLPWFSTVTDIFVFIGIFKLYRHRMSQLLGVMSVVFSFYVYLNLILNFVLPSGIGPNGGYLIGGNYNQMGLALFVSMVVNVLYSTVSGRGYINTGCMVLASVFSVAYAGSMTATVGYVLLVICIWLSCFRISKIFIPIAFVLVVGFYVVIVIMNNAITGSYVEYFIEDVLQKDLSFTGRTVVWESAVELIMQRPLFGYGFLSTEWNEYMFNVLTPHNMVFLIFLTGGLVWFLSVLWIVVISVKKVRQYQCQGSYFLQYASCIALLMMAFETYRWTLIFIMLILMYNSDKLFLDNELHHNNTTA